MIRRDVVPVLDVVVLMRSSVCVKFGLKDGTVRKVNGSSSH